MSVPIYDFAIEHQELASEGMDEHAAGRAFVKDVSTLSISQETRRSVPFAMPTDVKQTKRRLTK
jgi:hypothetical protein